MSFLMGSGRWDNLRPKLHPKASKFRQQFALKSLPNSGSQRKHQCLCFDVWPQKGEPPFRPGEARKGPSLHCLQVYTKRALILMHNAYSWLLSLALLPEPTAPNIAGPFLCICVYVYVPVPMCVCVCVSAAVIMQATALGTQNSELESQSQLDSNFCGSDSDPQFAVSIHKAKMRHFIE